MKIMAKGLTTDLLHNLTIRIGIPSGSFALLMLKALTTFDITSSLKQNEECLSVKTYCGKLSTVLWLMR